MRALPILAVLATLTLLPTAAAAAQVKILGGYYEPGNLEVLVGEEITFVNEDSMPHTVTSTWDSGATFDEALRQGESFAWTFTEPGTYTIHCRPHAYPNEETGEMEGMVMQVTVRPVDAGAGIAAPVKEVPAPALVLVLIALVGCAMLLRRR